MDGPETKMIVGLGNPGEEYVDTRHNIGFRVIDSLAESLGIDVRKKKFGGWVGSGELADKKLILLKPMRFMNRSGEVVATAVSFYKLALSNLLVVSDDMALPVGKVRIRPKGSSGGHNGLADVIEKLGTENVSRLRVGIGRSDEEEDYDYVLSEPEEKERLLLDEAVAKARDAAVCWVEYGIEAARVKFNPP